MLQNSILNNNEEKIDFLVSEIEVIKLFEFIIYIFKAKYLNINFYNQTTMINKTRLQY